MQTFGKTMRNSSSAIALGLLTAFGLASVVAVSAPAAVAQAPKVKAKKEFVDNFNAANTALTAKQFQVAIDKANAAQPHAADNSQKCYLDQIRTAAYFQLQKHAEVIKSAESAMGLGCIQGEQALNYKKMLAGAYAATGNETKAVEMTKQIVDQNGGDSTQYGFLAKRELDNKNFEGAVSYAQKAIDQTQKEGKSPNAVHYNIMLNAYSQSKDMDKYYETLERAAPIFNQETYWKPLIERAKNEPKYKANDAQLDIYRTHEAAGVKLSPADKVEMGELALNRGMAVESERILGPLMKDGTIGGASDKNAERSKRLYTKAQTDSKYDLSGGLEQSEKDAATKPTGDVYAITGESYMSAGKYDKAIELMKKGLEKGQLEPGTEQLVKLRLGIAQFKAGQKDEARKTWSEVNGDNGSAWLAKVWTALSKI
jgi:tetratricopeptide (TPR) repeat protein